MPQVGLPEAQKFFVNYGSLDTIDFDNWAMLEGHGALEWQNYYDSPRTFFNLILRDGQPFPHGLLSREPDQHLASSADFAWYLLALSARVFIPHPGLSASYVVMMVGDDRQIVHKLRGYCDNDLLRQGPRLFLRPEDAAPLQANASKLHLSAGHNQIVDRLLAPYRRLVSVDPDPSRIFSLVSVLEQLLNPDGNEPLGRSFAARLVAFVATSDDPAALERGYELGRRLYDLRSCVIHGGGVSKCMGRLLDVFGDAMVFPVELLSQVICRLASLEAAGFTSEDLPQLLGRIPVRADRAAIGDFVARLPVTVLEPVGFSDGE
jgi:hypothetical protein